MPLNKLITTEQYVQCIKQELVSRGQELKNRTIQSIYFGGGTPSLLSAQQLEQIIVSIQNYFSVSSDVEINIEINPGTIFDKKLQDYLALGINRFSVGVQTFSDSMLKSCGREHSSQETRNTLQLLSNKNLNYSCDLLFALPHQTLNHVQKDLNEILSYQPPHISTYCLNLSHNHFLQNHRPTEPIQIEMYKWIEHTLKENHFHQYEISNYCKNSFESKHNQAYWTDQDFWGLGVSSHSYLKYPPFGARFWNPKNLKSYKNQIQHAPSTTVISHIPKEQIEFLTLKEALSDFCCTSLRTKYGINRNKVIKKFDEHILQSIQFRLSQFVDKGMVIQDNKGWSLSFQGRMLSNQIFSSLVFS